ncbi:MAG TPA: MBL fold metallo-hydrolase [Ilumatobacteraceae bacterium]
MPAKFGDAILLTYGSKRRPHRILIDAGLAAVAPAVLDKLGSFDGPIDLFVVTHVDIDHIGGAVRLLNEKSFTDRVLGVWFNGFKHLDEFSDLLGPIDGERLTTRLVELGIPWNAGWPWRDATAATTPVGGPVVAAAGPKTVKLPGGASAIVISPTPTKLAKLIPVWKKAIEAAGLSPIAAAVHEPAEAPRRTLLGVPTLEEVAARASDDDNAEANGSSIGFVFRVKSGGVMRSVLFAADNHPDVLIAGLDALRKQKPKYKLDACKLPHHGSRRNVTRGVVQRIDCPLWLFSSNGVQFSHPNPEALARVVVDGGPNPTIVGNYDTEFFTGFRDTYPPAQHGYTMTLPESGSEGISIEIG